MAALPLQTMEKQIGFSSTGTALVQKEGPSSHPHSTMSPWSQHTLINQNVFIFYPLRAASRSHKVYFFVNSHYEIGLMRVIYGLSATSHVPLVHTSKQLHTPASDLMQKSVCVTDRGARGLAARADKERSPRKTVFIYLAKFPRRGIALIS